jgi:hypothetical protein
MLGSRFAAIFGGGAILGAIFGAIFVGVGAARGVLGAGVSAFASGVGFGSASGVFLDKSAVEVALSEGLSATVADGTAACDEPASAVGDEPWADGFRLSAGPI